MHVFLFFSWGVVWAHMYKHLFICATFVISSLQYLIVKLNHNYLALDCVIAVCNFASSCKLLLLCLWSHTHRKSRQSFISVLDCIKDWSQQKCWNTNWSFYSISVSFLMLLSVTEVFILFYVFSFAKSLFTLN